MEDVSGNYFYMLIGAGLGLVVAGVIQVLFLKNLYDLLNAIREPNRRMQPGLVWLVLIGLLNIVLAVPLGYATYKGEQEMVTLFSVLIYLISAFVVVWEIRMVRLIADSIEAEYDSRGIPIEYRPSYQTGMFMVVSNGLTLLRGLSFVPILAILGYLAQIAYLIGVIAYWVRTHKYKKDIRSLPLYQDEESLIFKGF